MDKLLLTSDVSVLVYRRAPTRGGVCRRWGAPISRQTQVKCFPDLEKSGLVWLNGGKENICIVQLCSGRSVKTITPFIATKRKHSLNPVTLSHKYPGARGSFVLTTHVLVITVVMLPIYSHRKIKRRRGAPDCNSVQPHRAADSCRFWA